MNFVDILHETSREYDAEWRGALTPIHPPGRASSGFVRGIRVIDTHSHLLAGLDDGARDLEESLEMCRIAHSDGIEAIVATPHAMDGRFEVPQAVIRDRVDELNRELQSLNLGLSVFPGMEVRVSPETLESIDKGEILPLNDGKYILLEFHPAHIPAGFVNFVSRLIDRSLRLILAHPEKNAIIQRHPEFLFNLAEKFEPWEVLFQITAASITGANGLWVAWLTKRLLKNNLVHLVATDAHDTHDRSPLLSRAVETASRIVGEERASQMVKDIPRAVLLGEPFPEYVRPTNPRRRWQIF